VRRGLLITSNPRTISGVRSQGVAVAIRYGYPEASALLRNRVWVG